MYSGSLEHEITGVYETYPIFNQKLVLKLVYIETYIIFDQKLVVKEPGQLCRNMMYHYCNLITFECSVTNGYTADAS